MYLAKSIARFSSVSKISTLFLFSSFPVCDAVVAMLLTSDNFLRLSPTLLIDPLPIDETDNKGDGVEGEVQVRFFGKKGERESDRDGKLVGEEKRIERRKQEEEEAMETKKCELFYR